MIKTKIHKYRRDYYEIKIVGKLYTRCRIHMIKYRVTSNWNAVTCKSCLRTKGEA